MYVKRLERTVPWIIKLLTNLTQNYQFMKSAIKFSLKDKNILKPIYAFAKARKVKLYLVGGILRDMLLDREKQNPDFDFCLKSGSINFARLLAKKIRCGFVVLDKQHGACRLVKRINNINYTFDFTDFRGSDLKHDLLHRDFTINTLALELGKVFEGGDLRGALIDPLNATQDLKNSNLKVTHKKSFSEDPLRILRCFSLACIFGFRIDKQTLKLAGLERNKLAGVSFERIREELFKIFAEPCAYDSIVMLDKLRILKVIFPEIEKMRNVDGGPYHHLKVLEHSLETVKQLEGLIQELSRKSEIQAYLNLIVSSERTRASLMKLAALLHDIGKPASRRVEDGKVKFHGHERIGLEMTENIARRLKLSNDEISALRRIVMWHLRPGYLADSKLVTKRAAFRFFRDTREEAVSVLLLSIADQRATRGRLTTAASRAHHERIVFGLIKEYFRKLTIKPKVRLVNGDILMKKFKLQPSELIGKILSEVEELQAIGKVKTKQEALKAADKIIKGYSHG